MSNVTIQDAYRPVNINTLPSLFIFTCSVIIELQRFVDTNTAQ